MSKHVISVAFIAALLVQIVILVSMPARQAYTLRTGRSVLLQVEPVDSYTILSGYYIRIGFSINRVAAFPNISGLDETGTCYAVLERGEDGIWKPLSLERELPKDLPENRIAISGRIHYSNINYGIEQLYFPESKRQTIERDLRDNMGKALVEIKVDSKGNAALYQLRIEDRIYE
jgi:uncharacterized membrane-anchored protein